VNIFTTKAPRRQEKQEFFHAEGFGQNILKGLKSIFIRRFQPWRLGALVVKISKTFLVMFLAFTLVFTPGMIQPAFAQQDDDSAPDVQVAILQQLAQKGYLGDKKDFYLSAKSLTDDEVTDGLLKINELLSRVVLKSLKPGDKTYHVDDLKALLPLVKDKAEDIRARKVSAWKFEKRVEKMIAYLTPAAQAVETPNTESPSAPVKIASKAGEAPKPPPTVTPIPGPNREEWDQMKSDIKDLLKKANDLQDVYDKKMEAMQKTSDEIQQSNQEIKMSNADNLEQLKLVKKIMEQVQGDLKQTQDRLDQVSQKADQKNITDTELQQELTIMHKDLRDDTQDVSILKMEVAKLDKSAEKEGQDPLDEFLNSKWLAGSALLVGLGALVVSLTRK
jgi:hypothetical protein